MQRPYGYLTISKCSARQTRGVGVLEIALVAIGVAGVLLAYVL